MTQEGEFTSLSLSVPFCKMGVTLVPVIITVITTSTTFIIISTSSKRQRQNLD